LTVDYLKELPFTGSAVNNRWALANKATLEKLLRGQSRGVAWFEDQSNRAEAVQILKAASGLTQEDVEKSYDFFRNGHFFEGTGKVSRSKLNALAKAMESLGDMPGVLDVDKLALPGITQMTD
jgi:ABC-type nitrate/sulfonate/bicarbonate transport system substrate-binding protein